MATKKTKLQEAAAGTEARPKVTLPPTFKARVNQLAHRQGKMHADLWRMSVMGALQGMADKGAALDQLSEALAAVEADPRGERDKDVDGAVARLMEE